MTQTILFLLFLIWSIPLFRYRSRFRKIVYQTNSWLINVKPLFIKEVKALFGNLYPGNREYLRFRNFYRFYLIIYLMLLSGITYSNQHDDMKSIAVGSKIPSFQSKDQNGNPFTIASVLGKKNLVIYFYPKDDSPGCTKEACSFRDQFEVFRDADAEIIGISSQSVESHKKFAEKYHLSYLLLSDEDNQLRKLFGVPTNLFGLLPGRVTYIVDKSGTVVHLFNSQIQAEKHVEEALKILKKLQ